MRFTLICLVEPTLVVVMSKVLHFWLCEENSASGPVARRSNILTPDRNAEKEDEEFGTNELKRTSDLATAI